MKNFRSMLLVLLIFALAVSWTENTSAQTATKRGAAYKKAYANSQTDTLPSGSGFYDFGAFGRLDILLHSRDSAAADVYFDTRPYDGSWTNSVYADSLVTTTNTGTYKLIALRNATADNVPGVLRQMRMRVVWRAAGNGVTSGTYDATFGYAQ